MEELKANPDKRAVGTVVEAQLDKGRGPVHRLPKGGGGDGRDCGKAAPRYHHGHAGAGKALVAALTWELQGHFIFCFRFHFLPPKMP